KGATISIARVNGYQQIIGGYNPLNWYQNGQYANTGDSFLFNLTDSNNLNSAKIGRVFQNHQNALFHHIRYGPTFGGGNDLRAQGNNWYANNGHTYTNISIPSTFVIDEYEVFQVVKKS
ncbi:5312_t:CDS:1, partial [Funneliformis geosporum]